MFVFKASWQHFLEAILLEAEATIATCPASSVTQKDPFCASKCTAISSSFLWPASFPSFKLFFHLQYLYKLQRFCKEETRLFIL